MRLIRAENEMLEGKYGDHVQKSMEILVGLGECYDADEMIPIASAHIFGDWKILGEFGTSYTEEIANDGGKCIIFTDTNPVAIDSRILKEMDIPEDYAEGQMRIDNAQAKMGVFLCHTCTPYDVGNAPRQNEHIAWSESSAVVYANSVLGARTNREGGPSSLAAALTGRVPAYGYHLEQNRYGDLRILVTAKLRDAHDYGALGYFLGKVALDRVPVLIGIPRSVSSDELKIMGAGAANQGSVALYHVVGVTPEAPSEKAAFGPKTAKDWQTFEFGEKELQETEESLSVATSGNVDLVVFGCPHASIREIREIAQLLSGKKLRSGVELWIQTSRIVSAYAERTGYLDIIEASGAKVLCETCVSLMPKGYLKKRGIKVGATNSTKMRNAFMSSHDVLPYFGSTEGCVNAAISGIWG